LHLGFSDVTEVKVEDGSAHRPCSTYSFAEVKVEGSSRCLSCCL
jgi:hypothetical protein